MGVKLTPHAEEQIRFRKLSAQFVIQVVTRPQQVVRVSANRYFAQSRYQAQGKEYLLRVLVEDIGDDRWIITVYPTSKIAKYWLESEI